MCSGGRYNAAAIRVSPRSGKRIDEAAFYASFCFIENGRVWVSTAHSARLRPCDTCILARPKPLSATGTCTAVGFNSSRGRTLDGFANDFVDERKVGRGHALYDIRSEYLCAL